jgi:hypothetical protein
MREEHSPAVADPLMKVDLALGGIGGEVGSDIIDSQ